MYISKENNQNYITVLIYCDLSGTLQSPNNKTMFQCIAFNKTSINTIK